MSFDADEEILQDFLVEAGEILELLSEQLVDLEQRPHDKDLLNAIFRGFHTVKGGAGFLQLNPLVNCCHAAENVFDTLRNGHRTVNSDLMDVVLQALDSVNEMFESVRSGAAPDEADPELIERLHLLARPESEDEVQAGEPDAAADEPAPSDSEPQDAVAADDNGDITDDEFEQLLDALDEEKATAAPASAPEAAAADDFFDIGSDSVDASSDEITEDEFEALLDQIHGKGKIATAQPDDNKKAESAKPEVAASAVSADGDDLISDSEFEELLDRLHGKGKHSSVAEGQTAAPV
ncbi:MAG: Hpt domain-containing protein, partial [Saccharospirillaceae bacterium]|nr:Hpt domain-containing protein [Saccharospirillaceae bacterium]